VKHCRQNFVEWNCGLQPDDRPQRQNAAAEAIALDDLSFEEKQSTYKETMAAQAVRMARAVASMSEQTLVANAEKIAKMDATARKALSLESDKPRVIVNVGLLARPIPQSQICRRRCPKIART
jgi:hypothetical protein